MKHITGTHWLLIFGSLAAYVPGCIAAFSWPVALICGSGYAIASYLYYAGSLVNTRLADANDRAEKWRNLALRVNARDLH